MSSPTAALLFGVLVSVAEQSSSVVSGLAVLAVTQQILSGEWAVWVVAGANMGTTSTALQPAVGWILSSHLSAGEQVALVHTLFNLTASAAALLLLPRMWPWLENWLNRA